MKPSLSALIAANAPETDRVIAVLVQLGHSTFGTIRLRQDLSGGESALDSNGNTFTPFPFEIFLPDQNEEVPKSTFRVDNIGDAATGPKIARLISEISPSLGPIDFRIMVVFEDDPDTIELDFDRLKLRDVVGDISSVVGEIKGPAYFEAPLQSR
ncbi:MAG: DUF1833 family protein, partial [Planctomycetota bacterium]